MQHAVSPTNDYLGPACALEPFCLPEAVVSSVCSSLPLYNVLGYFQFSVIDLSPVPSHACSSGLPVIVWVKFCSSSSGKMYMYHVMLELVIVPLCVCMPTCSLLSAMPYLGTVVISVGVLVVKCLCTCMLDKRHHFEGQI